MNSLGSGIEFELKRERFYTVGLNKAFTWTVTAREHRQLSLTIE
jgi:hypothetical protein